MDNSISTYKLELDKVQFPSHLPPYFLSAFAGFYS